jgi:hypothetical protein
LNSSVGRRSLVPITCSVAWLQRGWATCGLTLAQKPYSDACRASQKVFGRCLGEQASFVTGCAWNVDGGAAAVI